jgi:ATP-dependent Zn protease
MGVTQQLPERDRFCTNVIMLDRWRNDGRPADEEIVLHTMTSGAENDL